jgi:type IV pilus assembly protein PilN
MIRINLLPTDRERVRRKPPSFQIAQKATLVGSLIVVATGLGILWWWWALDRQSMRLDADLAAAQRESARLRTLIQQVEDFEKRKQQLQQRVALIEELRKGQSAPVHLIDQVSRALPDTLWLTELKQEANGDLTIDGRCVTLTALSDFVSNLERSGYFKRPVEILDSKVTTAPPPGGELIEFSIKARFHVPGTPEVVPAAAAARSPGRNRRAR